MCKSPLLVIAIAAVVASAGVIIGTGAAAAESLAASVTGKRDGGLAAALRRECRLKRFADFSTVHSGGVITDIFSGGSISSSASLPGYALSTIVPAEWWTDRQQGAVNRYGDTVSRDLCNLALMPVSERSETAGMPVGEPERVTADHKSWQRGTASLYGIDVAVWSPFKSERGKVARTYLYMALMYPQRSLTPTGMMVIPDGDHSFSEYWRQLLLRWATDYPPTESEREYYNRISQAQGGANPFVLLPGIEQYIWGEKRGQLYGGGEGDSELPLPLRGSYTRGETIYLTSPHIPADAVWAIDGKSVESSASDNGVKAIQASTLSEGSHRLTYSSPTTLEKGCVIILIKP